MATNEWMKIGKAARYIGVSIQTLRRMAHDRQVPANRLNERFRFRRADLDKLLAKGDTHADRP